MILNKGLIEGVTHWDGCFLPARLFVLSASFGMHGVKTIINGGIESFNSTDLLGQMQTWSLFVSVVLNQGLGEDWIQSPLLEAELKQTHGSNYLEIFVNNIVKIEWIGIRSVWATWFLPTRRFSWGLDLIW